MKKKGHRDVPDFSRHPSGPAGAHGNPEPGKKAPAKAPTRQTQTAKPQATSSKAGRRGQ